MLALGVALFAGQTDERENENCARAHEPSAVPAKPRRFRSNQA